MNITLNRYLVVIQSYTYDCEYSTICKPYSIKYRYKSDHETTVRGWGYQEEVGLHYEAYQCSEIAQI
jgi:hypothetical protein